MSIVSNRYIQALLELPKSDEENKELEQNLKDLAELYNNDKELQKVLLDPRIENNSKIEIIQEIFPKNTQKYFMNFVKLLIEENRINLISEISKQYEEQCKKENKILDIKIISAYKISDDQIQIILNKYKSIYKAKAISYKEIIDENLLGGIKVMVGNKIYDGSVQTQLKHMF